MLLYLLSRIISSTGAFLYPTYASYKALSRRPASEAELERWLMYWSVLGTIIGIEYVAEWTISWIPFYHPLKTLFLLYLALPQTRGASYMYTTHLHPTLAAHEADIDAALARACEGVVQWAQSRTRRLWVHFSNNVARDDAAGAGAGAGAGGSAPPPTIRDPASGPAQLAYGLWRTYGPALLASGAALAATTPTATPSSAPRSPTPRASPHASTSAVDVHAQDGSALLARRRALEAELAALPMSSTYLPAQGDERGRYEEIARDEAESEDAAPRRSSWWWGRADGYQTE